MREHWFWWLLMCAVLVWYSTVTLYITVRGTLDVRQMLRRLGQRPVDSSVKAESKDPSSPSAGS